MSDEPHRRHSCEPEFSTNDHYDQCCINALRVELALVEIHRDELVEDGAKLCKENRRLLAENARLESCANELRTEFEADDEADQNAIDWALARVDAYFPAPAAPAGKDGG